MIKIESRANKNPYCLLTGILKFEGNDKKTDCINESFFVLFN